MGTGTLWVPVSTADRFPADNVAISGVGAGKKFVGENHKAPPTHKTQSFCSRRFFGKVSVKQKVTIPRHKLVTLVFNVF